MQKIVHSDKYVLLQYGIDPITAEKKEPLIFSNRLHEKLYRLDVVIDYFKEFVEEYPDWRLIIGGTGSETELLKQKVVSLKLDQQVDFVGWLQKIENSNYYAKSMIYCSIPESDGTSVSVLEAMSAGCIPVVADLPVSKEWIQDGVNGVIEKSGENPLKQALTIDAAICTEINQKLIHDRATRSASIKRFMELYSKVIYGN
jgi:glycosyltransferase involved in cell wall biosynthesis